MNKVIDSYVDLYNDIKRVSRQPVKLTETETHNISAFSFSNLNVEWFKENYQSIISKLLSYGFGANLSLNIYGSIAILNIINKRQFTVQAFIPGDYDIDNLELSDNCLQTYNQLIDLLTPNNSVSFATIMPIIEDLNECNVSISGELNLFLNKDTIVKKLSPLLPQRNKLFISCYLFPSALKRELRKESIVELERQFFKADKKSVLFVFGLNGVVAGDFLSICGSCSAEDLDKCLAVPDEKIINAYKERFDFRSDICNQQIPFSLLMPESLKTEIFIRDRNLVEIQKYLNNLQAFISILSLSTQVIVMDKGEYIARFEGEKTVSYVLTKENINTEGVDGIISLYEWAYENISYDKIGIIRNIMALYADNFDSFIDNLEEIIKSARRSYLFYLNNRIEDYFDTRRRVREIVKDYVNEISTEIMKLTKEVNENIYKTVGIIAAAVVAVIIRPENIILIVLIGILAVVVFLVSILVVYLPSMKKLLLNRDSQYRNNIMAFSQILEQQEVDEFLQDETIMQCEITFNKNITTARWIYIAAIIITIIIGLLALIFIC